MFEVKHLFILIGILFLTACVDQNKESTANSFNTDIDSSLFSEVSINDVSFLIPKEMTLVDEKTDRCEYNILHREEHLIFSQTPCNQVFEKDENLETFVDYFQKKKKNASSYYEVQSIDSVMFKGQQAFVVCYLDKPWGFPTITHNECFIFKNANKFNVLHTWSIEEMDSLLLQKSKYTFEFK